MENFFDYLPEEQQLGAKNISNRIFSYEEAKLLYDCYININLKNILNHPQGFKYKWLSLENLVVPNSFGTNWKESNDPFARKIDNNKILLAKNILDIGTYFPVLIKEYKDKYLVKEGKHRITSLKLAQQAGIVPNSFKIFCLIIPDKLVSEELNTPNKYFIYPPMPIVNIFELKYGKKIFEDKKYKEKSYQQILNLGGFFFNDYLFKEYIYSNIEIHKASLYIPTFMKDLVFQYNGYLQPSIILNNQIVFKEWRAEKCIL